MADQKNNIPGESRSLPSYVSFGIQKGQIDSLLGRTITLQEFKNRRFSKSLTKKI